MGAGRVITSAEIRSAVFCVVEGRLTCRRTLDAGDINHFGCTHAGNTLNPAPVSLSLLFYLTFGGPIHYDVPS